jgi:hypothetical protein
VQLWKPTLKHCQLAAVYRKMLGVKNLPACQST